MEGEGPSVLSFPFLHLFEVPPECLSPVDDSIVLSRVYFSQSEMDVENSVKNPPPLSSVTLLQRPTF